MQISLSVDDKTALKVMAAERGMTVAALIHEWVDANRKEADTAWQKGTE
jgi:predicted DNA-binding ribbon-helix-helix protein